MSAIRPKKIVQLREWFENSADKYPNNLSLVCDNLALTYQELEEQANQLANYLISQGINKTHCIGILIERSLDCYISVLAVLKTGASYVPIEAEYPDERINFILADMSFHSIILSSSQIARQVSIQFPKVHVLNEIKAEIAKQPKTRPALSKIVDDQLCYIIYTSGSTGKPKGVEVTHHSICHYISVASELYEMSPQDRVYQGFSLAFDASLEEIWMAFANGATLISCTSKEVRSGIGLIDFLQEHKVTVFSTIPSLLSTLPVGLPHLRLLILGGEVCSEILVKCWSRKGLKILNTYGPTETTVIATYSECQLNKPVSIGKALPGYKVIIIDENLQPVSEGQEGELCIAGAGLARGYVDRPELTSKKFITNPIDPSERLYRTGDLARAMGNGDIQFLGRIDDQIKLRGFRIELNEVEAIIMQHPSVKQAVVKLHELEQPTLVAYLKTMNSFNMHDFKLFLIRQLPYYMLPSIYEIVDSFPLLPNGKINRQALPKPIKANPDIRGSSSKTELEQSISDIWEKHLKQKFISLDDDFFYDLGGHSLTAAAVISDLRLIPSLKHISMRDLYQYPTIKKLAEKLQKVQSTPKNSEAKSRERNESNLSYYLCGIGQFFGSLVLYSINAWRLLAIFIAYLLTKASLFTNTLQIFEICFLFIIGLPIFSMTVAIFIKWVLVGRIKPGVYKLWGWFYFRWWIAKHLQASLISPSSFLGTPILPFYYRLLGAKIGKNCYIGTANIVNPDLLTIGDNSSIGLDVRLTGYVVEDGWLKLGTIKIGSDCFIGARSVVGIDTQIQDSACLGDMSLLRNGGFIPKNKFYSGSPAVECIRPTDHITSQCKKMESPSLSKKIRFGFLHYCALIFTTMIYYLCFLPALLLVIYCYYQPHYILDLFIGIPLGAIIFLWAYYLNIGLWKKILMNRIKPGIYPLLSLHYLRQWIVVKMLDASEISVMADSLYFPHILFFLGAKIGKRVEMGETPHLIPELITIHDEGFTASAVALAWPSIYQGSIKYAPIQVGKRAFVGNDSVLPQGTSIGNHGLLGCMSITPPGNLAAKDELAWLGSPAIFLPRREMFTNFTDAEKYTPPKRLIFIRYSIEFVRILLPTLFGFLGFFSILYVLIFLFSNYSIKITALILPVVGVGITMTLVIIVVLLKWLILGRLKPLTKPIWSLFIWKNDIVKFLYNYFVAPSFVHYILGSPLVAFVYRIFGAKIGKRVFIDTSDFSEFDLVTIGDDVCINYAAIMQTHLYEDRIFKMSTIKIGNKCNVGVASIVLYNAVMGKNSTLGDFSLLMKGEYLPEDTHWQGIPALAMNHNWQVDMAIQNEVGKELEIATTKLT